MLRANNRTVVQRLVGHRHLHPPPLARMRMFSTSPEIHRVVFYSWQSDLPNATNRSFIQEALETVAKAIKADDTVDVEPVIDRDTQGVAGAPDIAKTGRAVLPGRRTVMSRSFFALLLVDATGHRSGTEANCAARSADQRRQAVDAGAQGAEVDARVQSREAVATALESLVGCVGDQSGGRPTDCAVGIKPAGDRHLRGHGGRSLCVRRQGKCLKPAANGDIRKVTGTVAFVAEAPWCTWPTYQSCRAATRTPKSPPRMRTRVLSPRTCTCFAHDGLGVVVRGSTNRAELAKALNLRPNQRITLAQTVGYVKKSDCLTGGPRRCRSQEARELRTTKVERRGTGAG